MLSNSNHRHPNRETAAACNNLHSHVSDVRQNAARANNDIMPLQDLV